MQVYVHACMCVAFLKPEPQSSCRHHGPAHPKQHLMSVSVSSFKAASAPDPSVPSIQGQTHLAELLAVRGSGLQAGPSGLFLPQDLPTSEGVIWALTGSGFLITGAFASERQAGWMFILSLPQGRSLISQQQVRSNSWGRWSLGLLSSRPSCVCSGLAADHVFS